MLDNSKVYVQPPVSFTPDVGVREQLCNLRSSMHDLIHARMQTAGQPSCTHHGPLACGRCERPRVSS